MSQEEIKLGWYKSRVGLLFHALGFRTDNYAGDFNVVGYWQNSHLDSISKGTLHKHYEYLGPELGEWVDAEVTLMVCELPIRARGRTGDNEWQEGLLSGIEFTRDRGVRYSLDGVIPMQSQCQVWRAKKV